MSGAVSRVGRIDRAGVRLVGTRGTTTITGSQFRSMINQNAPAGRQLQSTLLFFRPIGSFDVVEVRPGVVSVAGWAFSQGNSTSALAHVYVNDRLAAQTTANLPRADVASQVPGAPANSGWSAEVTVDRAVNNICAYGVAGSGNGVTLLGCRTVTVDTKPFGSLDRVNPIPGGVRVAGWAMDPNAAGPIDLHVYINGRLAGATTANTSRGDVGTAYPAYGPAHGFDASFPVDAAANNVCVYMINVGPGENTLLGCRSVTNHVNPFGSIDVVRGGADGVTVAGWAIDPDTADPIDVHIYVGSAGTAIRADGQRNDLAAVFPGYGTAHGFTTVIPAGAGNTTVCVYAINVRAGANQLLGCRNVVVPANPYGALDVVRATPDGIRVAGWAIDPNTTAPIDVHAYVGSRGTAFGANLPRTDVATVFPGTGPAHGFDNVIAGRAGDTACLYMINVGPGENTLLGCRTAIA